MTRKREAPCRPHPHLPTCSHKDMVRNIGRVGMKVRAAQSGGLMMLWMGGSTACGPAAAATVVCPPFHNLSSRVQEYQAYLTELHRSYPDYWASWCLHLLCCLGSWEVGEACLRIALLAHPAAQLLPTPPIVCLPCSPCHPLQVKPIHFGFADNRSMFVSFEGQVSAKQPKFAVSRSLPTHSGTQFGGSESTVMARRLALDLTDSVLFPWIRCLQGVDFFVFNNDATKIQEVQGEAAPCPLPP